MAFAKKALITIDNTKVSGSSNHAAFPVLISGIYAGVDTDPDFRTAANGGAIQNTASGGASGSLTVPADLRFYDDEAGTTQYDHEFIAYNASTGAFKAYVRIPTLSYNSDTTLYVHYSDSGVTTSQENIGGVWETNYKGVWHLQAASGTRYDSSGNGNHLTDNNTVASATGKIGTGADFELSNSEYLSITDASQTGLDITGDFSFSCWLKFEQLPSVAGSIMALMCKEDRSDGSNRGILVFVNNADNKIGTFWIVNGSTFSLGYNSTGFSSTANFYHVCASVDVSVPSITYTINGVDDSASMTSSLSTSINNTNRDFSIGAAQNSSTKERYFDGIIETHKIYSGLLSQDWFITEYNNQNSPSTFYSIEEVVEDVPLNVSISGYTGVRVF